MDTPFFIPTVQTPKSPILSASKDYFLNDIFFKICHQVPLLPETPGAGRASPNGMGAEAAEGRPGCWLAGVPGRGGGRGARAGGGKAACREQPRAGRARRARAPAGAGRGREEPRAAAASAGGAAGPPHSPPAPPRSLALTPGHRRRAARAPPAPHGRPRHGALRPHDAAQLGPARHAEVRGRERGGINMQISRD